MANIKKFIYPPTGVEHIGEVIDSKDGFDVIECKACGFKHVIPIPTEEEMGEYYSKLFHQERPTYVDRYHEDIDWWRLVYEEKYEMLENHLPFSSRRILDIGCGLGLFLKEGEKRGWDGIGIEPAQQAAEYARNLGLEVINESICEDHVETLGRFNVVHMHEVLEHIPNPADILQLAHRLLEPDGLLCVVAPNDYNPLQKVFCEISGSNHWWVAPPVHINYFTFESMEKLMKSLGFQILEKTGTFPMEIFLLMGDNYIGNDSLGRNCHNKRKKLELNLKHKDLYPLKHSLYSALSEHGVGRELVILAKKVGKN